MRTDEEGFTLVELLTVVLIIAMLASLAIPIFLNQRVKGQVAQQQSSLKGASKAVEGYAVENDGNFSDLDELQGCCADATAGGKLAPEGFHFPDWYEGGGHLRIEASDNAYCIEGHHSDLPADHEWKTTMLRSAEGGVPKPAPAGCPEL